MKVLKFGGTSVANSESISNVISILNSNRNDNLMIVVSALGGITNLLQECLSLKGKSTDNVLNEIEGKVGKKEKLATLKNSKYQMYELLKTVEKYTESENISYYLDISQYQKHHNYRNQPDQLCD